MEQTRYNITSVKVYVLDKVLHDHPNTRAFATVVLDDQLILKGLLVQDGETGLFVAYPQTDFFGEEFPTTTVFPMTRALREHIENIVLQAYQRELERG